MGPRRISDGDVKCAQDELSAREIDGVADEGIDHFHERCLDTEFIFDEGDRMKARVGGSAHAAEHALMKIAEDFAAEGGRAAGNSVDLDVGAETDICGERHGVCTFRIKISKIHGFRL